MNEKRMNIIKFTDDNCDCAVGILQMEPYKINIAVSKCD